MTIRVRIALFGLLAVGIVLIVFTLAFYALFKSTGSQQQDRDLAARALAGLSSIARAAPEDLAPQRLVAPVDPATSKEMFVVVLGADGEPVSATGAVEGAPPAVPPALLATADEAGLARATVETAAGPLRVYVLPWNRPDLGLSGHIIAAQTTRRVEQDLSVVGAFLVAAAVVAFVVAGGAIWLVIGRALRPLKQLARLTDEVGQTQDLGRRLPVPRARDDVRRLSESFNAMMARLEGAYGRLSAALESQRRFVADASHELRTPLTTIRNNAGFLLQRPQAADEDRLAALNDIASESERMSRLVHDLLTLARADAGFELEKTPVELQALVLDVRRQASRLHPLRDIEASTEPATVTANEDAIKQLLWILIGNAVAHTCDGGHIRVALRTDGATASLAVEDDGEGIPEAALGQIFERFYQADPSRSSGGAGLGLSIARWIVEQHGGTISAAPNEPRGAVFRMALPLTEVASAGAPAEAAAEGATRTKKPRRGLLRGRQAPREA